MRIRLNSIEAAKDFCLLASDCPFDIDLRSGHYRVNAKSILGIFSLDLTSPVDVIISNASKEEETAFISAIENYIA